MQAVRFPIEVFLVVFADQSDHAANDGEFDVSVRACINLYGLQTGIALTGGPGAEGKFRGAWPDPEYLKNSAGAGRLEIPSDVRHANLVSRLLRFRAAAFRGLVDMIKKPFFSPPGPCLIDVLR